MTHSGRLCLQTNVFTRGIILLLRMSISRCSIVIPPAGGADLFYDSRKQIVEVLECYFSASVLAPDPI